MSYWENEEPISKPGDEPALSPVYSLAVQSEALWLLSGLESGCINLQSVRHDEGKRIAFLQKHTSAVSVLSLSSDEKSVLSGSWDKSILDWDLNTGQVKRSFTGSGGQISAIEIRPASSLPVPEESGEPAVFSTTFSSNNADKPTTNGFVPNGVVTNGTAPTTDGTEDASGSPVETNSLFGDTDSLFGDGDGAGAPSGGNFAADDDDEFSKAIGGMDQQDQHDHLEGQVDATMEDAEMPGIEEPNAMPPPPSDAVPEPSSVEEPKEKYSTSPRPLTNGLAHAEELGEAADNSQSLPSTQDAVATSDSTFLAAAIDGTLRVWDRRVPSPVAKIPNRPGVPPWCMAACWSPDGNYIYAGRRNGTVEEFSLHKGLKAPERTFKFPAGSGAVSAVRAMPNGRHLIWFVSTNCPPKESNFPLLISCSASHDILRLYDLKRTEAVKHSTVPFLIVPGPPRAGVISALHIDPTCRYMLSAAGNRGWEGNSTEVLIGYEIGVVP
jgi:transcriptional activator SPT8